MRRMTLNYVTYVTVFMCLRIQVILSIRPECFNHISLFYEELSCTPAQSKNHACPTSYDCEIYNNNCHKHCVLDGKVYMFGMKIPEIFVASNCYSNCKCVDDSEGPKIQCDKKVCDEKPHVEDEDNPCYNKYELDQCCSVGEKCAPFEYVWQCLVDGTYFLEGQKFEPSENKTLQCVCQQQFSGIYEPPFCTKKSCLTQIEFPYKIKEKCAPLFMKIDDHIEVCPHDFICLESNDVIITNHTKENGLVCVFGDKTMQLGDYIKRDYETHTILCECTIPPLATCTKTIK